MVCINLVHAGFTRVVDLRDGNVPVKLFVLFAIVSLVYKGKQDCFKFLREGSIFLSCLHHNIPFTSVLQSFFDHRGYKLQLRVSHISVLTRDFHVFSRVSALLWRIFHNAVDHI